MTDWVRLYHDMPTDPKWRVIAKRAGQRIGDVIAVFNFLLCNASGNAVKRGVTQNIVTEDIAAALDISDKDVCSIIAAMEGKVIRDGALTGWKKRNPIREDNSTARVKRFRATRQKECNAPKRPESETESPPISPKGESKGAKRVSKVQEKVEYTPEFETFWKAYDPPKNSAKRDTFVAWGQVEKERPPPEILLAAVQAHNAWIAAETRRKKTPQLKKLAETWLRKRAWEAFVQAPRDPAHAAESRDRADRLMHRGKYAEGNGEPPAQTPRSLGGLLDG